MSDSYLDVFTADRAITALATRARPEADDDLLRTLGSWVESIDADVPDPATDLMPVARIDVGRRSLRITALVVAGVLALMSTGVAFAVGDHPFAPIERVVRHVVRPAKVEPLGAPPADESSAVGAQPSGSGSASGLDGRVGGARTGTADGRRSLTADGPSGGPQTEAISTTIIEITPTLLPMPTIGPSIPWTLYTKQTGPPTRGTAGPTDPTSTSPSLSPDPTTTPPTTDPPSTDTPSTTTPSTTDPPSTDTPSTTTPPSTDTPSTTTPPSTDTPSTASASTQTPATGSASPGPTSPGP
jgi:hypothetical protein